jgi:hypothetical protein
MVKIFYHGVSEAGATARKYDPRTESYTPIETAALGVETIDSQPTTVISYEVTDGQSLDIDGEENGIIVDPIGLAATANSVPGSPGVAGTAGELAKTGKTQVVLVIASSAILAIAAREARRKNHIRFHT